MAELTTAFNEDHEFLAKFIERDRLARRWRCTGRYLKAMELAGTIKPATRVLGVLRYLIEDITRVEEHFTQTGRSPMDDEKRRNEALVRLHLYGHGERMAEALEILLNSAMDKDPAFTAADIDGWVRPAVVEVEAIWAIADKPVAEAMNRLVAKPETTAKPSPALVKMVNGGK